MKTQELPTTEQLACGRTVDDVWQNMANPPTEHERTCPYCQNARATLEQMHELAGQWRESGATDPEQQPADGLKRSIMDVVRDEFRGGRRLELRRTEFGQISVREAAIAQQVRDAAGALPGVRAAGCAIHDETDEEQSKIRVVLSISVAAAALQPTLLDEVRAAVGTQLRREFGWESAVVDLVVEDVHDAE